MEITGLQALNLYEAVKNMKANNVSATGMAEIDLGIDKSLVEHIIVARDRILTPTSKMSKFLQKAGDLKTKHSLPAVDGKPVAGLDNPAEYLNELEALRKEYAVAIEQNENRQDELDALMDKKFDVALILVDKKAFKFDGPGGAEIMAGLAPILKD